LLQELAHGRDDKMLHGFTINTYTHDVLARKHVPSRITM